MCLAPPIVQRMEESRRLCHLCLNCLQTRLWDYIYLLHAFCGASTAPAACTASILPQGQVQDPGSWAPVPGCPCRCEYPLVCSAGSFLFAPVHSQDVKAVDYLAHSGCLPAEFFTWMWGSGGSLMFAWQSCCGEKVCCVLRGLEGDLVLRELRDAATGDIPNAWS